MSKTEHDNFADLAAQARRGLVAELWDYLKCNKKWWLLPILLVLLLLGTLVLLGGSGAGPFIYTFV